MTCVPKIEAQNLTSEIRNCITGNSGMIKMSIISNAANGREETRVAVVFMKSSALEE